MAFPIREIEDTKGSQSDEKEKMSRIPQRQKRSVVDPMQGHGRAKENGCYLIYRRSSASSVMGPRDLP